MSGSLRGNSSGEYSHLPRHYSPRGIADTATISAGRRGRVQTSWLRATIDSIRASFIDSLTMRRLRLGRFETNCCTPRMSGSSRTGTSSSPAADQTWEPQHREPLDQRFTASDLGSQVLSTLLPPRLLGVPPRQSQSLTERVFAYGLQDDARAPASTPRAGLRRKRVRMVFDE
jgi:hypothetical protein